MAAAEISISHQSLYCSSACIVNFVALSCYQNTDFSTTLAGHLILVRKLNVIEVSIDQVELIANVLQPQSLNLKYQQSILSIVIKTMVDFTHIPIFG